MTDGDVRMTTGTFLPRGVSSLVVRTKTKNEHPLSPVVVALCAKAAPSLKNDEQQNIPNGCPQRLFSQHLKHIVSHILFKLGIFHNNLCNSLVKLCNRVNSIVVKYINCFTQLSYVAVAVRSAWLSS